MGLCLAAHATAGIADGQLDIGAWRQRGEVVDRTAGQFDLGRFDGENYNIGFMDVCNRPYQEMAKAGRISHASMYKIAAGRKKPFNNPPEYLTKVFY